jgi:polyisoprenoid-binding protein YceI
VRPSPRPRQAVRRIRLTVARRLAGVGRAAALVVVATLAAASAAQAAPESFTLDPAHTVPVFAVSHLGLSVQRGMFTRTSGTVVIDRAEKSGRVEVAVDAASLETADRLRDRILRGDSWFDVERFPTISYRAQRIVFDGDVPVAADGELTLLGVTRPVRLAIRDFRCGTHSLTRRPLCGAEVTATVRRSDFGMSAWLKDVGDEVTLTIQAEGYRD